MNESVTRTEGFESMLESLENRVSTDQAGYEPDAETALVVSCSMDHRSHCRTLWPVEPTWNVAGVSTLGNQTWERYDGQTVLDGTLEQFVTDYDVSTALVVGHTGCDVVTDAYERCVAPVDESPPGIAARLGPLVSLAEDAQEEGVFDESTSIRTARYRLVEYNVVRQVAFLRERLPDSITTVGYVYDQDAAYSSFPDKHYLVTLDGETEIADVPARLIDDTSSGVASLL